MSARKVGDAGGGLAALALLQTRRDARLGLGLPQGFLGFCQLRLERGRLLGQESIRHAQIPVNFRMFFKIACHQLGQHRLHDFPIRVLEEDFQNIACALALPRWCIF